MQKFSNKKDLVLELIEQYNKQGIAPTRAELTEQIRKEQDIREGSVSSYVSDLLDEGKICPVGKRVCKVTGNQTSETFFSVGVNPELKEQAEQQIFERENSRNIGKRIKSVMDNKKIDAETRLQIWDLMSIFVKKGVREGKIDWGFIETMISNNTKGKE